jgi:hypothetical protein
LAAIEAGIADTASSTVKIELPNVAIEAIAFTVSSCSAAVCIGGAFEASTSDYKAVCDIAIGAVRKSLALRLIGIRVYLKEVARYAFAGSAVFGVSIRRRDSFAAFTDIIYYDRFD